MSRSPAAPVILVALALACGCGGDEEAGTRAAPEPPELTIPRTERETQPTETAPAAPPPTTPDPGYESAPAPPPPMRPDSPENDSPPPPGSPAERFELECDRNPEACG